MLLNTSWIQSRAQLVQNMINELPMCRRQRWQERTPIWWLQDDRYQRSWWQARTPIWWLQDDRLRRGFLLLPQLSEQEGGVSRILVTDLFDEPCQSEETDHFFIRSSVNYRTNEELSEVIEWASVMEVVCSLQPIIEQTKNSLKLVKEHPSKNSLKSVKERQSKEVEQQYNFWHWSTITGRCQSRKEAAEYRENMNF